MKNIVFSICLLSAPILAQDVQEQKQATVVERVSLAAEYFASMTAWTVLITSSGIILSAMLFNWDEM
ncbi:MAG: hypothetical protein JKY15_05005 [Deltaproteobacteria bacterium]|nr:hypothetical protein [Deltaproteobacteria bacterium]